MSDTLNSFRVIGYTLPANGEIMIDQTGDFVRCLASSAAFEIAYDGAPAFIMEAGLGFRLPLGRAYTGLRLVNPSGAPVTLQLALGYGDIQDSRIGVVGNLPTMAVSPNTLTSAADVSVAATTTAMIAAANPGRAEIILQNLGLGDMRIGDSAAAAGRGVLLAGGGTLTLTTTAAVYAYNASAGPADLSVLEIERV